MQLQSFGQNCNIIALGREKLSYFLLSFVHYMEEKHQYTSEIGILYNLNAGIFYLHITWRKINSTIVKNTRSLQAFF